MTKFYPLLLISLMCSSLSCETIAEPFKTAWGSSTRALEEARIDALNKTYECEFDDCFNAVLSLERSKEVTHKAVDQKPPDEQTPASILSEKPAPPAGDTTGFQVFIKDRIKAVIVVMGIYGNIDTTEVGIFFSRYTRNSFKVEISSLSDSAKRKVAAMVFEKLDKQFQEVK